MNIYVSYLIVIPSFMVPLSPIRPEGAEALRLWYAVREKPCPQHALKGQKLIAQGSALGCLGR